MFCSQNRWSDKNLFIDKHPQVSVSCPYLKETGNITISVHFVRSEEIYLGNSKAKPATPKYTLVLCSAVPNPLFNALIVQKKTFFMKASSALV